jgi:deoxyadenosine/deoxycytidine kinase
MNALQLIRSLLTGESSKPIIVSIEGNIGAGKSTLLRKIESDLGAEERDKIVCMQEPVDLWESVRDPADGESILKKFYKDQVKYAFAFQIMAYTSRLEAIKRTLERHPLCEVLVCERSLEADCNIFAKMASDDGVIDSVSYQVYEMLYKNTAIYPVDCILYLRVEPEICLERIATRGRDGEGDIKLEYLKRCHKYYEDWISAAKQVFCIQT